MTPYGECLDCHEIFYSKIQMDGHVCISPGKYEKEKMDKEAKCKWFWEGNSIYNMNVCKRHAPIVIPNPCCDKNTENVRTLNYTDGEYKLSVFPNAFCTCGDYEPREETKG